MDNSLPSIEITTVSHCKNVCSYCPQALLLSKYGRKEFMSFATFKACINKVPKNVNITFAGYSEPFLNSECSDMMVYVYEQGYNVVLFSTLVGLTKTDVDKISKIKFQTLMLHLPDNLDVMKANVDDEYVDNTKYFIDNIPVTNSHVYGPLHDRLIPLFPNYEKKTLADEHLHTRANNVSQDKIALTVQHRLTGKLQCGVVIRRNTTNLLNFNVLLPSADVMLCCMDYGLEHRLGNLLIDSYEDLFQSKEYLRVQAGLLDNSIDILCRTCKEAMQI